MFDTPRAPSFQADPTENLNNFFVSHPEGIAQILLAIGIVEGTSQPGDFWWGKGEREAGAWSFDPTNFYGKLTQQKKNDLTLKELKNGRLGAYLCSFLLHPFAQSSPSPTDQFSLPQP